MTLHLTISPHSLNPALPLLLLLEDSTLPFSTSFTSLPLPTPTPTPSTTTTSSSSSPVDPFALLPTLSLPTLTFSHGARGGNDTILSEPSAIALFLESKLSPNQGGSNRSAPEARARLEQMRAFAATFLEAVSNSREISPFQLLHSSSREEEILQQEKDEKMSEAVTATSKVEEDPETLQRVHVFLSVLEHHLQGSFFPPLLSPPLGEGRLGTTLTPAAAWIWSAVEFVQAQFPGIVPRTKVKLVEEESEDERGIASEKDEELAREVDEEQRELKYPHTKAMKDEMDQRPGVKKLRKSKVLAELGSVW